MKIGRQKHTVTGFAAALAGVGAAVVGKLVEMGLAGEAGDTMGLEGCENQWEQNIFRWWLVGTSNRGKPTPPLN